MPRSRIALLLITTILFACSDRQPIPAAVVAPPPVAAPTLAEV